MFMCYSVELPYRMVCTLLYMFMCYSVELPYRMVCTLLYIFMCYSVERPYRMVCTFSCVILLSCPIGWSVHYCKFLSLCRSLSDAVRGPERELGVLSLKAPRNCPTLSTSPGRKKATGRREMRGGGEGDRGGGEKGNRGVMTTNDLLKATSVELV